VSNTHAAARFLAMGIIITEWLHDQQGCVIGRRQMMCEARLLHAAERASLQSQRGCVMCT
jgi:hypothetical protein